MKKTVATLSLLAAFTCSLTAQTSSPPAAKAPAKAAKKASAPPPQAGFYPPKGIPIPPTMRAELSSGAARLGAEIESLRTALRDRPQLLALLPDIQIFHNAVRFALEDEIFYKTNEFAAARALLQAGHERVAQLRAGTAPWTTATGNVVRGYVSKLDGSVQPYGLLVPAGYRPDGTRKHRLDLWFHGRGDTLSEVNFLTGRMGERAKSQFTPEDTFVLHPYGRFMNAFKFAGEVDVFEALEHVRRHYRIDDARLCARGFSMGGAAAWHLGAHHASQWAAVNPGAGFVDVWVYQNIAAKDSKPAWYEQKLWRLYDATNYAANFFNTTLVAYSGELDRQKQAADLMEAALAAEGMKMTHIIGPKTEHKYEPTAQAEVARRVDAAAARGVDPLPQKVRFVLFSLRFNRMAWVTVDALEQHWERATVEAEQDGQSVRVRTRGITGLTLELPAWSGAATVDIDGQTVPAKPAASTRTSTTILGSFVKQNGRWQSAAVPAPHAPLAKRHGLQGPIDDAFMDSFLFVQPTGPAFHPAAGAWVNDEFAYATGQWRRQHRGEPRVKDDSAVTGADIAAHHLVLFGDPQSNVILKQIADQLPIRWTAAGIVVGDKTWPADRFAPAFIFPNPLNPRRYVVVNSGFTFAVVGGASNSQQTPKLPDWAVLDMTVPRADRLVRGVADANFFNERWELTAGGR
jgi:dienelactone hydrolase